MKYLQVGQKLKNGKVVTQELADNVNPRLKELSERKCGMPRLKDGNPCERHIVIGAYCRDHVTMVHAETMKDDFSHPYTAFAVPILQTQMVAG